MWERGVEYLKDPLLVIKVQRFFGVIYKKFEEKTVGSETSEFQTKDEVDYLCHKRIPSNTSSSSQASNETETSNESENKDEEYECYIGNRFWYSLFVLGTALGDEIFYASFIPIWFWNIDSAVGRRVVLVWSIAMYIGQSFKDIIRWPRPGYPVHRLQNKWAIEYGMPSTHAIVAVTIPFSVLFYTYGRYQYNFYIGLTLAVLWCSLVCVSRVYLGMHSVLDIVAGLILSIVLISILIPIVDRLDYWLLSSLWSPILVFSLSILVIVYYPNADRWTPTRGDTTMIISVCAGILIGSWTNYQLGNMKSSDSDPPYPIIWPSIEMIGNAILRTTIGLCGVVATRAIGKSLSYGVVCAILRKDPRQLAQSANSLDNTNKIIAELCYKYFVCGMIGISTAYLFPNVFHLLNINRPTFYTEI